MPFTLKTEVVGKLCAQESSPLFCSASSHQLQALQNIGLNIQVKVITRTLFVQEYLLILETSKTYGVTPAEKEFGADHVDAVLLQVLSVSIFTIPRVDLLYMKDVEVTSPLK
ncbi:hypothetical protein AVEN_68261-1 [Araneus ventricosus]|uniref:Uncharacterized protein n=1 Tax=Araneus ventricosus TaxID=182803 RepID=A0A4Y2GNF3_ARAVE|nr:hypothetical protein AVEN_68261-1 [Araneus ventricosus]